MVHLPQVHLQAIIQMSNLKTCKVLWFQMACENIVLVSKYRNADIVKKLQKIECMIM